MQLLQAPLNLHILERTSHFGEHGDSQSRQEFHVFTVAS